MRAQNWEAVESRTVFERFGRAIVEIQFKLPSGAVEPFTVRVEPPTVAVLAIDEAGQILVTRQFRPGPRRILCELPGGYVDANEDIKAAAERELIEETGYAGEVTVVGSCFSDSYSASLKYCAVAPKVERVAGQKLEPEEFIEVASVSVADFRKLLRDGSVADVDLGYMALDWLGLL